MSVMPWGTMNGWLRLEIDERASVQHHTRARRSPELEGLGQPSRRVAPVRGTTPRQTAPTLGCPEAA